jgi:hypothetical protein
MSSLSNAVLIRQGNTMAKKNMQSQIIMERLIAGKQDMDDIEAEIRRQLMTDHNRCAFLRSLGYIRLRIAALYPLEQTVSHSAFCGNLSVSLVPTTKGPFVTLRWLDKVIYCDEKDKFSTHRSNKRKVQEGGEGI